MRPAAEGAGPWKPQGLGFSCVPWSKLLNVPELQRAEHRGGRRLPVSGQGPGRAATCCIMGPR